MYFVEFLHKSGSIMCQDDTLVLSTFQDFLEDWTSSLSAYTASTVKFHDVFYVSLLNKYVKYVDHVID